MNIYVPKENMWVEFLAVFIPIILIFALVFGYFSFSKKVRTLEIRLQNQEVNLELAGIAFDDLLAAAENMVNELKAIKKQALADYIQTDDRLSIIETVAHIYENRLSNIELWKEKSCFTYCGKGAFRES